MTDVTNAAKDAAATVASAPAKVAAAVEGTVQHDEAHLFHFVIGHPKTDLIIGLVMLAVIVAGAFVMVYKG